MAPPIDRLYAIAAAIVGVIEDGFATAGVDLPERRYVAPGLGIPWDCDLLAVQVGRTFPTDGDPAQQAAFSQVAVPGHTARALGLRITLLRCVPVIADDGAIPAAADEELAAAMILTDSQTLVNVLAAAERAGQMPASCNGIVFDDWNALGPDGGYAGGALDMRIFTGWSIGGS